MSGRTGRLVMGGWLTLVWVLLWGSPSPANVLGGAAVATVLLVLLPLPSVSSPGIVRPAALVRFVGFFAVDLVRSSLQVAALVLRPRLQLRQAVIAVPARVASSARRVTLHLPTAWPWETAWSDLFTRACGPPVAPTT